MCRSTVQPPAPAPQAHKRPCRIDGERDDRTVLSVRVPAHYQRLIRREIDQLGRRGGPLYNVAHPKAGRFETFAPGEVVNYVQDFEHMPDGLRRAVVHRYPAKLLFFPTDCCVGHCQYCFRPDVTAGTDSDPDRNLTEPVLDRVCRYLWEHPRVREVIFSGGDPLRCDPDRLDRALERISTVPTVRHLRLHTRGPIWSPDLVGDRLIDLLTAHDVKIVLHVVHPYELDAQASVRLARFRRAGVLAYNQFPLLRGVNDHPAVVTELAHRCVELGIQMLTMFVADPIRYGAVYRLRLERVYDIADQVFLRGEGWISNFRVCLDSPAGKVRREHIVCQDPRRDLYVFARDGRTVEYRDIPADMDAPTPLGTLLYRGGRFVDPADWR